MGDKISVYRPTGPARSAERVVASGLRRSWESTTVALVDNGKPGALALLTGIADELDIPAERRVMVPKQIASRPMNDDELRTIKENCDAAILAVGNCGSCTSWTCHDAITVTSDFGIPAALIVTTPFIHIGQHVSRSLGYPDLPMVAVEHPVGDLPFEVIRARGAKSAIAVREALLGVADRAAAPAATAPTDAPAETGDAELLVVERDQAAIDELYQANNWSDGLPIVAPTEERITAMLGRHAARADEVVGTVATGYGVATLRAIAVNAVMAGCSPEYFDVVVAAVKGVVDPAFNLHALQATTHPVGPMILVNGPVAAKIGMNAGTNAMGQGNRANATIGRALRLVLITIGRCVPGVTDRATFGNPGKYTFCLAENESASPWEPFHVSRGLAAADSAVTVFGAEGTHNMNDPASVSSTGLLKTFVGCMCTPGSNHHQFPRTEPLVVLAPEHATLLAREGFTRASLQEYFFQNARIPLAAFSAERIERFLSRRRPVWFGPGNTTRVAALADSPSDFLIAVSGGPGTHSVFVPSFGGTAAVTVPVEQP
ncbi:UGSC family (seleno)protein [Actinophytocola sp.]|uniref:UGSC family (seleno)protein n=1 Tax=Actinophytocola sp. TaxID=1872138 RepID=UPI003D6A31E0